MQLSVDPKLQVLRVLSSGGVVELSKISERTGLTSTAIDESIAVLAAELPELETLPDALKLNRNLDLLDPKEFCEHLPEGLRARVSHMGMFAVCESTNFEVIDMGIPDPNSMNVAITEYQTGGHGRRGRSWKSGFAGGLCLTIAIRLVKGRTVAPTLTLAIGATLAAVLERNLTTDVLLKWPNDLLISGSKLGGILVEVLPALEGDQLLRIGVGINCDVPATDAMSGDLPALPPVGLNDHARYPLNRTRIATDLVEGIVSAFDKHSEQGFDVFRSDWQARDYLRQQTVQVSDDERVRHGTALGINRHGALRVSTDEGEIQLMGGEVRVRRR